MGKDIDEIKDECAKLSRRVKELYDRYHNLYKVVLRLADTFETSKGRFVLTRNSELKAMIKACVTDQVLDAAANRTNDESIVEKRVSSGRTSRLLQLTESYSKLATGRKEFEAERSDIEGLNKNDLAKLIKERKKQKSELEEKFIRLHENLLRLKRDYDYSKRYLPVKRYGFLKDMVKPVIRNERLKETYTA